MFDGSSWLVRVSELCLRCHSATAGDRRLHGVAWCFLVFTPSRAAFAVKGIHKRTRDYRAYARYLTLPSHVHEMRCSNDITDSSSIFMHHANQISNYFALQASACLYSSNVRSSPYPMFRLLKNVALMAITFFVIASEGLSCPLIWSTLIT